MELKLDWFNLDMKMEGKVEYVRACWYLCCLWVYMVIHHCAVLPLCVVCPVPVKEELKCFLSWCLWSCMKHVMVNERYVHVDYCGDAVDDETSAMVLCNHSSMLDYMVIASMGEDHKMKGRCNFLIWKKCVKFPDLRIAYQKFRISENWRMSSRELDREFHPAITSKRPYWTVVFPEVDSYTAFLHDKNVAFSQANHAPVYQNLLSPRYACFTQPASYLKKRGGACDLYDVTLCYWAVKDGQRICKSPTLLDVMFNRDNTQWNVDVHVKKISMKSLPRRDHGLQKWLERTWIEKDGLLKKKHKTIDTHEDHKQRFRKRN